MLSLMTAGAPEGGLSGGCQGAILSSRRLNVKKEIPIIFSFDVSAVRRFFCGGLFEVTLLD